MSVLLSDFEYFIEKKFGLSTKVWVSIFTVPKFLLIKSAKKCCHVGILEAFQLWTLGTSVKAERLDSCTPPIKLLDFLHLSTDRHSVKPLSVCILHIVFF